MNAGNARRGTTTLQRVVATSVLALVAALLPVALPHAALAPSSAAAANSTIFGVAVGPGDAPITVTVQLFNSKWSYLGQTRSSKGGVFRFSRLPAGQYFLQASDSKQVWDIKRLARTDASVSVGAGQSAQRDIVMHRGSFVTGVVKVGKKSKAAARATVRVASQYGASYTTVADKKGRFAVGGLPGGQRYSVFAWDRKKAYSGKSIWLGLVKTGKGRNVAIRLRTKTAAYAGILRVNGVPTTGTIWATAVSRVSGQWWTAPIRNGDLSTFTGLFPGPYILQLPQTSQIYAQNLAMPAAYAGRVRLIRLDARALPVKPKPTPTPCPTPSATATSSVTTTVTATATATATLILATRARVAAAAAAADSCPSVATVTATATATATATVTKTVTISPSPTTPTSTAPSSTAPSTSAPATPSASTTP